MVVDPGKFPKVIGFVRWAELTRSPIFHRSLLDCNSFSTSDNNVIFFQKNTISCYENNCHFLITQMGFSQL